MLQAKEMQQMVKLEAEMDRRPATVVWNSRTQTETTELLRQRAPPASEHRFHGRKLMSSALPSHVDKVSPETTETYFS